MHDGGDERKKAMKRRYHQQKYEKKLNYIMCLNIKSSSIEEILSPEANYHHMK